VPGDGGVALGADRGRAGAETRALPEVGDLHAVDDDLVDSDRGDLNSGDGIAVFGEEEAQQLGRVTTGEGRRRRREGIDLVVERAGIHDRILGVLVDARRNGGQLRRRIGHDVVELVSQVVLGTSLLEVGAPELVHDEEQHDDAGRDEATADGAEHTGAGGHLAGSVRAAHTRNLSATAWAS